jgi:hypothetical protein
MTVLRCLVNGVEGDRRIVSGRLRSPPKWLLRLRELFRSGHVEEINSRTREAVADLGGQFDWAAVLGLNRRSHRPSSQRN